MVERRVVTSANPTLADLSWPVFEAKGAHDGPRLTLMSGIHGCEYPAIAAVRRFMRELDTAQLSGSILAVPFASPTSFTGRSAFVVPEDGTNINRTFPGDPDGSFTEALADHLFREFISGADLFIDLHGGDLFEALEPFAIYQDSPQREQADAIARAFNFPYVIVQREGGLGGMTSWAAAQAGIPGIIAEVGGCGLLEPHAVEAHLAGVHNALRAVGMLEGSVTPSPIPQYRSEDFRWMRCRDAGWWQSEVTVGEMVESGQRLGAIQDPYGDEIEQIIAPLPGAIGFLTTSPAVTDDGLLLAIAGELTPLS
jgi:predicted deacylase